MSELKICIVEDDEGFYKLLVRRLKSIFPKADISRFNDIQTARSKITKDSNFDLVFLDQHLPDGRGITLLEEGYFANKAVISMSSDTAPEMPGQNLKLGADYFLPKQSIAEPLFEPLVRGILDRNQLQVEALRAQTAQAQIETVKTLVSTLRHEVNNPLGAVLGAAYILKANDTLTQDQKDAVSLVEASGHRIKHVLEELCKAVMLDTVTKGQQKVFQVPGDKPWE